MEGFRQCKPNLFLHSLSSEVPNLVEMEQNMNKHTKTQTHMSSTYLLQNEALAMEAKATPAAAMARPAKISGWFIKWKLDCSFSFATSCKQWFAKWD